MNIGIIGGGRGGLAILNLLDAINTTKVKWVTDLKKDAPALVRARELNIQTADDFVPLLKDPSLDMVIEVTGVEGVKNTVLENKLDTMAFMDSTAAKLLITIVENREQIFNEIHNVAELLADNIKDLNKSSGQIRSSIELLASGAENLANFSEMLSSKADNASKEAEKTKEILKLIEKIAIQTNIIGLNASIESARAGQVGKGFSVVATEIRKMADSTKVSSKEISDIIFNITQYIDSINSDIKSTRDNAQEQATAIQEIAATLETMAEIYDKLHSLSDKLVRLS